MCPRSASCPTCRSVCQFFGLGIIAAISYLPVLQGVFKTAPLSVYDWLMLAAFGLALLVADELRKAYVRSRRDPQPAASTVRRVPVLEPLEA